MMRAGGILVALAAATALTAGSIGAVSAAPPDSPFAGTWAGFDFPPPDGDGSAVTLTVGPGPAPSVTLHDVGATVCGGDPLSAGTFEGRGRYNRVTDTLTVNFTRNSCENGTSVGPFTGLVFVFVDGDTIEGAGATLDLVP